MPYKQRFTSAVFSSHKFHTNLFPECFVQPFEFGGATWLIRPGIITRGPESYLQRLKDFWDGFVQSEWLFGFIESLESQLKNQPPHSSQQFRNVTCRDWPNPRRWLMWPNSRRWLTENGQIPEDDLPRLAKSRITASRNLWNQQPKASSGEERFRLVISRNW